MVRGNGAPATRSVAQLVLMDSNFATLLAIAIGIVAIAAVVMETTANALEVGQRLVRDARRSSRN